MILTPANSRVKERGGIAGARDTMMLWRRTSMVAMFKFAGQRQS